ncbi:MAG: HAMP domain-containing histidine kinase [Lachnospiraceae bacterium]|nr:HAMP domain-containing histidine kinase [Lachnospiraceae bacterium]MCM1231331.1 HAMP domain-containing histidine kinase [Ruminococcus flavefaciens]
MKKLFFAVNKFFIFFGLVAFVVTCSFLLFFQSLDMDREMLTQNAKFTFFNVIFLSVIFCIVDTVRRKIMVDRPLKKIIEGLNKITNGDFSVQIPNISEIADTGRFNIIIDHINKMTAELSGVETLRNDFIANVSHELKTPLAVINNYGTLLQSPDLSEEERLEYAKAVTENSRRLANLITNILKLNKLENQQIYPKSEKYNLSEQLCECLLDFEFAWEQKNLEIDTDIDENIFINADSELLSLVWNNLFSNAVKFTDNSGKIFVGLKKNSDFAIVTVTDTGCGMSAETGRHIFEKFYQGDTSHAGKGNGLGLALVKHVVDITNGEISVQSEIGKGSTFIVKLRCDNEKQ